MPLSRSICFRAIAKMLDRIYPGTTPNRAINHNFIANPRTANSRPLHKIDFPADDVMEYLIESKLYVTSVGDEPVHGSTANNDVRWFLRATMPINMLREMSGDGDRLSYTQELEMLGGERVQFRWTIERSVFTNGYHIEEEVPWVGVETEDANGGVVGSWNNLTRI